MGLPPHLHKDNKKLLIQKYKNNKLINKEISLLGNYLLCFHEDFKDPKTLQKLKFSRGLEYFLNGFKQSQKDINDFIHKCRNSENEKGSGKNCLAKLAKKTPLSKVSFCLSSIGIPVGGILGGL